MRYYPERFRQRPPYSSRAALSGFKGIKIDGGERALPCDYASAAYNAEFKNGKLKRCANAGRAEVLTEFGPLDLIADYPTDLAQIFVFDKPVKGSANEIYLVCFNTAGSLNYLLLDDFGGDGWKYVSGKVLHGRINGFNYRYQGGDVMLICSEVDGLHIFNGDGLLPRMGNAPKVKEICSYGGRVFMTLFDDDYTLWFTDVDYPPDWTADMKGFDYIGMQRDDGPILKIVSFLNSLYIFRQCGIWKLNAYGDLSDFTLSKLASTSRIYPDTIAATGEEIAFLTDEGVFFFDGYGVTKISEEFDALIKPSFKAKACAGTADGVYYVATECVYGDGREDLSNSIEAGMNNTVVSFDKKGVVSVMRGINVSHFASVNNNLLKGALFSSEAQNRRSLMQMNTTYHDIPVAPMLWRSAAVDFGMPDRTKVVKSIGFNSNCALKVVIEADGVESAFDFAAGKGERRANIDVRGRSFVFSVESSDLEAEITSPYLEFDIWREE